MTAAGRRPRRLARSSTVIIGGSSSARGATATPLPPCAPGSSTVEDGANGPRRFALFGRPRLPPGLGRERPPPPRRNGLGLILFPFLSRSYQPSAISRWAAVPASADDVSLPDANC